MNTAVKSALSNRKPQSLGLSGMLKAAFGLQPKPTASPKTTPIELSRRRDAQLSRAIARRQLSGVVADAMVRAGVLSSQFTFKSLALDSKGESFLVLVNMSPEAALEDGFPLLHWEKWICQMAKSFHSINVSSVYWRRDMAPMDDVGPKRAKRVARQSAEQGSDFAALSDTNYGDLPAA